MAYRSGQSGYLIRDIHKKDELEADEEEECEQISVVDDDERQMRREVELSGFKKKYTFTQRKTATIYHCRDCNRTFKHPSKIAEHMRKHTRERPFQCEICGARFTQGGSLKVHLRAHLGELPYKCGFCERQFATTYNLKVHEAVHMRGGRVHKDPLRVVSKEGKTSAQGSSQKEGEMESDLYYECSIENCGYQHAVKEMVENHIRSAHPEVVSAYEQMEGEEEGMEGGGEEGDEYQNYTYYEYVEGDPMMDEQEVVVMTEEEVAAVTAANAAAEETEGGREEQYLSPPSPRLSLHSPLGVHSSVFHPSTSSDQMELGGSSLMIETDEHIDDEGVRKAMTDDGRTKQLRLLTLGRTGIRKEEMYPGGSYSAETPPLASYEVEVMTSRDGNAAAAASAESPTIRDEEEEQEGQALSPQLLDDMEEPVDEGDEGAIRLLADIRPPGKGRTRKWQTEMDGIEADVDIEFLESMQARPIVRGANERKKKKGPPAPSRNLDWIIDAVAQGQDVDTMSPHNRKKPTIHTCVYCGKTDKYPSKIQAHMRTHTGEKPFKCEFCGMGFAQKTPLRMHIRRHLNDRSFTCDYQGCHHKFISQALLNAHISSRHENTKRFVCLKGCGRWFSTGRNQRQHETKCHSAINRTPVVLRLNPIEDIEEEDANYDETVEDGEGAYLDEGEEEEVEVDEGDEGDYDESIQMQHDTHHSDMSSIPPSYL